VIPQSVRAYVSSTRALCRISDASDLYQKIIHAGYEDTLIRHGIFNAVKVIYVYSQSKIPEFVVKSDIAYVVYDQYCGQFLNMCNRLVLYQPESVASLVYFHKIAAEEVRRERRPDLYVFLLSKYLEGRGSIPRANGERHGAYTFFQERFCLFHEIFHAAEAVRPGALAEYSAEASQRIAAWVKTASQSEELGGTHDSRAEFQDRLFGEKTSILGYAAMARGLSADLSRTLKDEVSADIFAFKSVVERLLLEVRPELDDPLVRAGRIRDAVSACYVAFLHLRTLSEVRTMLNSKSAIRSVEDAKASSHLQLYIARAGIMHTMALDALREHVPPEVLEYDYPRALAGAAGDALGVSEYLLSIMTLQKREYAAVHDPFLQVANAVLDVNSVVYRKLPEVLSRLSDTSEGALLHVGDAIWKGLSPMGVFTVGDPRSRAQP
jgi:hypothetical protein